MDKAIKTPKFFRSGHVLIFGIAIAAILISIGLYIYTFSARSLSSNVNDWAALGDYIGGVLSGVTAPLSVILIWLAYCSQIKQFAAQEMKHAQEMRLLEIQIFEPIFTYRIEAFEKLTDSLTVEDKKNLTDAALKPLNFLTPLRNEYPIADLDDAYRIAKKNAIDLFTSSTKRARAPTISRTSSLASLIVWVDNQPQSINKEQYMNLIKDKMHQDDYRLLFLAAISGLQLYIELAEIIVKYDLLHLECGVSPLGPVSRAICNAPSNPLRQKENTADTDSISVFWIAPFHLAK